MVGVVVRQIGVQAGGDRSLGRVEGVLRLPGTDHLQPAAGVPFVRRALGQRERIAQEQKVVAGAGRRRPAEVDLGLEPQRGQVALRPVAHQRHRRRAVAGGHRRQVVPGAVGDRLGVADQAVQLFQGGHHLGRIP